jgi:hypothetical protein
MYVVVRAKRSKGRARCLVEHPSNARVHQGHRCHQIGLCCKVQVKPGAEVGVLGYARANLCTYVNQDNFTHKITEVNQIISGKCEVQALLKL